MVMMIFLVSILAIYSGATNLAYRMNGGQTEYLLLKHLILIGLGLVVMFVTHLVNYRAFARLANLMVYFTVPLLLYTIVIGSEINEAARWITLFGQSFQPSDLAKLTLMVYLSKLLTQRQDVIQDFKEGFLPALFWVVVICGLIAPADLDTAALMFLSSLMVMFIAGVDMKYLGVLVMVAVLGVVILGSTAKRSATWQSRMNDYISRITDPTYEPIYQVTQSNIAIASGGVFGKGVGKSTQRHFLPQAHADYVYAIIIEEYGLFGALLVIGLYLGILFRCVSIVTVSKTFGALTAAGLSFTLVLQAMLNMGVCVGLFPASGLPLPMISMGGTSIVFSCISLGIILSVSREAMEQKPASKAGKERWNPFKTQPAKPEPRSQQGVRNGMVWRRA